MKKISIYDAKGKTIGDIELNAAHFDVKPNPSLIHEAVTAQMANARQPVANTKTRGEVRGGGKKPWRQKGTGRARHGSIRSPIWVGGGITFGPRGERNFSVKINRKAKQKALFMVLSDKLSHEKFIILDEFKPTELKTKEMVALVKTLPVYRSTLYVASASRPDLVRMARNLKDVYVTTVNSLNIIDVLTAGTVIFEKDAIPVFETVYRA